MIHLRQLAAGAGLTVSQLAKEIDVFAGMISPLTRASVQGFLDTVAVELLQVANEPIDTIIERLLTILARRRSPIPSSLRLEARGLLDFLRRPLLRQMEQLHAAIAAARPIVLRPTAHLDSMAAAVILEHVIQHYLRHPVSIAYADQAMPDGAFVIALGVLLPPTPDGFGLTVRDARTIRFSVSTQAWRLGQMLLMRYEKLRDNHFVIYDFETSGRHVKTAEILEVAALAVNGGIPTEEVFHSLVRPQGKISPEATAIHGIRMQDVRNAPTPAEVFPSFLHFLGDAILAGHNIAQFDHPILRRVARSLALPIPTNPLLDTCTLARRLLPNVSHSLKDLAQRFGIHDPQNHRALDDVRMNARILEHLLDLQASEKELDTLDEALPLVALGIHAAGIPAEGENELLVLAGARANAVGLGGALRARLAALMHEPRRLLLAEGWLKTRPSEAPDDDIRWREMVERWRAMIAHYCRTTTDHSLISFLHYAALAASIDYQPDDRGRVAMMTIHAAKGREWPLVFLIGAEEGTIPDRHCKTSAEIEEERRVLYVAMTRAKRRLCISWAASLDGRRKTPSRFLHTLPDDLVTWRGRNEK